MQIVGHRLDVDLGEGALLDDAEDDVVGGDGGVEGDGGVPAEVAVLGIATLNLVPTDHSFVNGLPAGERGQDFSKKGERKIKGEMMARCCSHRGRAREQTSVRFKPSAVVAVALNCFAAALHLYIRFSTPRL